jgi:3-oxoadipate enol-lactonase
MRIIDRGRGAPIVLIPGIQGRWEWMELTVAALEQHARVITFSLADEPSCGADFDTARGFWCYVDQVRQAMDEAGIGQAAICGVSYGGLIAAAFAARHPDRVSSLVLVSAIPPSWTPNARVRFYLQAPRLLSPLFMVASLRMYREFAAAYGGYLAGATAGVTQAVRVLGHMFSPGRMARRVHLLEGLRLESELTSVRVPTLVVTGEASLDAVVPVEGTRRYATLWPHARVVTIERTGHLGSVTRADEFARITASFVAEATGQKRRVG